MTFDRSWISSHQFNGSKYLTKEYKIGLNNFTKFDCENMDGEDDGVIKCPCRDFKDKYYKNPNIVKIYLFQHRIMQWYTKWDQ